MTRKNLLAIAAGLAMMAAPVAYGQGYIGGNVGASKVDVDCTGLTSCDSTDTGYKLYGGYQFGGGWAAEVAYFDWGKAKGTGTLDVGGTPITGSGKLTASSFGAGVAYFFPVSPDWVPVVRLGVARGTGKITVSALGESASDTTHSTEAYFGLGIGYKLMPNLFLTGEADFSRVKYLDSEKADVRLVSIGLRYSF